MSYILRKGLVRYLRVLVVLFVLVNPVYGIEIDQLKVNLTEAENPADSLDILLRICDWYDSPEVRDMEKLGQYSKYAISLSQKLNNREALIESKMFHGWAHNGTDSTIYFTEMIGVRDMYVEDGKYFEAAGREMQMAIWNVYRFDLEAVRVHTDNVLEYLKLEPEKNTEIATLECNAYNYISNSYNYGESYEKAIEYAILMKEVAQEWELDNKVAGGDILLGKIYANLYRHFYMDVELKEEAESRLKVAVDAARKLNNPNYICESSLYLGIYYFNDDQYDVASEYFNETLKIGREVKSSVSIFNALKYRCSISVKQNKLDDAYTDLNELEGLLQQFNTNTFIKDVVKLKAEIELMKGNLGKARVLASQYKDELLPEDDQEGEVSAWRLLEEIAKKDGRWDDAYNYKYKGQLLQDSILNSQVQNSVSNLKNKYTLSIKDNEIAELTEMNLSAKLKTQTYLLWGIASLACLLGGFLWFYQRNKNRVILQEKNNLDLEQKILRLQMNPHFIFNTISSIQNFLYDKSELGTALNYLSKFASLMRQTLENSREDFIPLSSELESLNNYLHLQQMRHNEKFDFSIRVEEGIDENKLMIPPLMAQPFVENAIEHGRIYQVEKGHVEVLFSKANNQLLLRVTDNGIGEQAQYVVAKNIESKNKSLAKIITQERLEKLSIEKRGSYKIFTDYLSGGGTKVDIHLPLEYLT